jgi:hypothetical protein
VTRGKELELQCAATGDPPPLIAWYKEGRQVGLACFLLFWFVVFPPVCLPNLANMDIDLWDGKIKQKVTSMS